MKEVYQEANKSVIGVFGEAAGVYCMLYMVFKVLNEWLSREKLRNEMVKSIYMTRVENAEEQ